MPEVHRYQVVTMLSMAGATIGYDPHGPDVVMASAFDEATRLFLDAAERCVAAERRENELQQRLTAADERNDNRDSEIFAQVQSALRRSFSLGQIYWQQADSDSTCQQNKSDQTMEVQEQHILNVLKSVGTALNPAEGAHDPAPLNPHWPADTAEELADYRAWRKAQIKPADGADYRKSCEVAHKALSMENQRVLVPGQFKCLACGDIHPGSGNLPCPKMSPTC